MITIVYYKLKAGTEHKAVFDNLEDAQLWWDSIYYLRNDYGVKLPRPA